MFDGPLVLFFFLFSFERSMRCDATFVVSVVFGSVCKVRTQEIKREKIEEISKVKP